MDLETSRCDIKPQIGQFGHLGPLFFLNFNFSTFPTGGKIVDKSLLMASRCELKAAKPHGFIFSMLSHMISYLPFWKPILRFYFFLRDLGCGKEKTVSRFLEFGFVVKPVQELNRCQIYVIERRKKESIFHAVLFYQTGTRGKRKNRKITSFLPTILVDIPFCMW